MKVRQGKAVSVAIYGDTKTVQTPTEWLSIKAVERGIVIDTSKPVFIADVKIRHIIQYLERFDKEANEKKEV